MPSFNAPKKNFTFALLINWPRSLPDECGFNGYLPVGRQGIEACLRADLVKPYSSRDCPDNYRGSFLGHFGFRFFFGFDSIQFTMGHYVYVIQSSKDDSYYIGRTSNLNERLKFHNATELNTGITRLRMPCKYFYTLEVGTSSLADKIEKHIKKMKSRKYILNLKKYPEISRKLIEKYS